jgi:hypothetical protein
VQTAVDGNDIVRVLFFQRYQHFFLFIKFKSRVIASSTFEFGTTDFRKFLSGKISQ